MSKLASDMSKAGPIPAKYRGLTRQSSFNTGTRIYLSSDYTEMPTTQRNDAKAQQRIEEIRATRNLANIFRDELRIDLAAGSNPEGERMNVNRWVQNVTRGRIQELFARGEIHSLTQLVLVNAAYFEGVWLQPFTAAATRLEPFYLDVLRKQLVKVPTMKRSNGKYCIGEKFLVSDFPLKVQETCCNTSAY
jgi:hypothetical protein